MTKNETKLWWSVRTNNLVELEEVLKEEVEINEDDLFAAKAKGYIEVYNMLLNKLESKYNGINK